MKQLFKTISKYIQYRWFILEDFFYHKKITIAIKKHNRYTHKLFVKQNKKNENA